jgi:hypothetical protein
MIESDFCRVKVGDFHEPLQEVSEFFGDYSSGMLKYNSWHTNFQIPKNWSIKSAELSAPQKIIFFMFGFV